MIIVCVICLCVEKRLLVIFILIILFTVVANIIDFVMLFFVVVVIVFLFVLFWVVGLVFCFLYCVGVVRFSCVVVVFVLYLTVITLFGVLCEADVVVWSLEWFLGIEIIIAVEMILCEVSLC